MRTDAGVRECDCRAIHSRVREGWSKAAFFFPSTQQCRLVDGQWQWMGEWRRHRWRKPAGVPWQPHGDAEGTKPLAVVTATVPGWAGGFCAGAGRAASLPLAASPGGQTDTLEGFPSTRSSPKSRPETSRCVQQRDPSVNGIYTAREPPELRQRWMGSFNSWPFTYTLLPCTWKKAVVSAVFTVWTVTSAILLVWEYHVHAVKKTS